MKKFFSGKSKSKTSKELVTEEPPTQIPTPIHASHAKFLSKPPPHQKQQESRLQPEKHPQPQQQLQSSPPHSQPVSLASTPTIAVSQTTPRNHSDEERWEVVPNNTGAASPQKAITQMVAPSRSSSYNSIPPAAPSPNPMQRPASPSMTNASMVSLRPGAPANSQMVDLHPSARKKPAGTPPVAVGILRALDPPRSSIHEATIPSETSFGPTSHSEERFAPPDRYSASDTGHSHHRDGEKKEKRGFWSSGKEKDKEKDRSIVSSTEGRERARERRREHNDDPAEIYRMIGYLTATASEDWNLVFDVCDRASMSDANAKEVVKALKREFKHGEPAAQLSAARLWAIMLRNSTEVFIAQSTSKKFLDTLEQVIVSPTTSPVVRERLLDVIGAAAYASGGSKSGRNNNEGFRGLWRRVRPPERPEEGVPFDSDDAMFNPPMSGGGRLSQYEPPNVAFNPEPVPISNPPRRNRSPKRNRVIPPQEDIRRLFQECKIGQGNASLLSQALAHTKPEELKKQDVVKEFYSKCQSSQELIFAQIPWASAGAERSRLAKDAEKESEWLTGEPRRTSEDETVEEKLLAALLATNAELVEVLMQYEDLMRIVEEKKVEARSRKEVRMDRRNQPEYEHETQEEFVGGTASHSTHPQTPSPPSPAFGSQFAVPRLQNMPPEPEFDGNIPVALAPPPPAPHGPRSPAVQYQQSLRSQTPSPTRSNRDTRVNGYTHSNGHDYNPEDTPSILYQSQDPHSDNHSNCDDDEVVTRPSAKALGKRKVVNTVDVSGSPVHSDEAYLERDQPFHDDRYDSDNESNDGRWRHPPVKYVYDAAAERTQQRLAMEAATRIANGVH